MDYIEGPTPPVQSTRVAEATPAFFDINPGENQKHQKNLKVGFRKLWFFCSFLKKANNGTDIWYLKSCCVTRHMYEYARIFWSFDILFHCCVSFGFAPGHGIRGVFQCALLSLLFCCLCLFSSRFWVWHASVYIYIYIYIHASFCLLCFQFLVLFVHTWYVLIYTSICMCCVAFSVFVGWWFADASVMCACKILLFLFFRLCFYIHVYPYMYIYVELCTYLGHGQKVFEDVYMWGRDTHLKGGVWGPKPLCTFQAIAAFSSHGEGPIDFRILWKMNFFGFVRCVCIYVHKSVCIYIWVGAYLTTGTKWRTVFQTYSKEIQTHDFCLYLPLEVYEISKHIDKELRKQHLEN